MEAPAKHTRQYYRSYYTASDSPKSKASVDIRRSRFSSESTQFHSTSIASGSTSSLRSIPKYSAQTKTSEREAKESPTEPTFSNFQARYKELADIIDSQHNPCFVWLKRKLGISGLKKHLIGQVQSQFNEGIGMPITMANDIERLRNFIQIILLIYCKHKELCMNTERETLPQFSSTIQDIDELHIKLFRKIFSITTKRGHEKLITKTIKTEVISTDSLNKHFPTIHQFYHHNMIEEANRYRENYQSYYPPFLIHLMKDAKSENSVFTRLRLQSSNESSGSSVHSGKIVCEVKSAEDTVFEEEQ